jgi:hypothetical protein
MDSLNTTYTVEEQCPEINTKTWSIIAGTVGPKKPLGFSPGMDNHLSQTRLVPVTKHVVCDD